MICESDVVKSTHAEETTSQPLIQLDMVEDVIDPTIDNESGEDVEMTSDRGEGEVLGSKPVGEPQKEVMDDFQTNEPQESTEETTDEKSEKVAVTSAKQTTSDVSTSATGREENVVFRTESNLTILSDGTLSGSKPTIHNGNDTTSSSSEKVDAKSPDSNNQEGNKSSDNGDMCKPTEQINDTPPILINSSDLDGTPDSDNDVDVKDSDINWPPTEKNIHESNPAIQAEQANSCDQNDNVVPDDLKESSLINSSSGLASNIPVQSDMNTRDMQMEASATNDNAESSVSELEHVNHDQDDGFVFGTMKALLSKKGSTVAVSVTPNKPEVQPTETNAFELVDGGKAHQEVSKEPEPLVKLAAKISIEGPCDKKVEHVKERIDETASLKSSKSENLEQVIHSLC